MLSGVGLIDERHLLMDKVVCSVYYKVCMTERCFNCPGTENLQKFLEDLIGDELDSLSYKQWNHTDGNQLQIISSDRDNYIEKLVVLVSI
jgi:hypothetical protein